MDSEFQRLDQDGDHSVSIAEFRTCFARFHLLFRSHDANALAAEERLMAQIKESVPQWMRAGAKAATKVIWGAFHSGSFLKAIGHPPGWRAYLVDNRMDGVRDVALSPTSKRRGSELMQILGFDVEEVEGDVDVSDEHEYADDEWELAQEGEWVPLRGRTYLRVTEVDVSHSGNGRDTVKPGDVIMTLFGRGGGTAVQEADAGAAAAVEAGEFVPALRSRWEFVALCKNLPFVSIQVFRSLAVEDDVAAAAARTESGAAESAASAGNE